MLAYPEMFYAQAYWLRANAAALNIKYVVHEGDITNNSTEQEWGAADHMFRQLDGNVPYALALGNHDYPGGGGVASRDTSGFDARFPPSRMQAQPGFVTMLDPSSAVNAAYAFEANGQTWLIFALELGPRDHVLSWVAGILSANPTVSAILVTHAYLFVDGTRFDAANRTDQYSNPHDSNGDGRLGDVNDAEEMWQKLIADRPQIRFVLCGHMHAQASLTSERPGAPPVHQLLADYQHEAYGGSGYLRLHDLRARRPGHRADLLAVSRSVPDRRGQRLRARPIATVSNPSASSPRLAGGSRARLRCSGRSPAPSASGRPPASDRLSPRG